MFAGAADAEQLRNICSKDVGEPGQLRCIVHGNTGADDPHARGGVHTAQHPAHMVPEL